MASAKALNFSLCRQGTQPFYGELILPQNELVFKCELKKKLNPTPTDWIKHILSNQKLGAGSDVVTTEEALTASFKMENGN